MTCTLLCIYSVCTCLEWDPTGEILAIGQQNSSLLLLYRMNTRNLEQIDMQTKEVSFLKWGKQSSAGILAVGKSNGAIFLYRAVDKQRIAAIHKHKRRIACGNWSYDGSKRGRASCR